VSPIPPGRRRPPKPVAPERVAKLNALADLHDQWVAESADSAGFYPKGRPPKSDYNIHHVDLDPDPKAGAQFHAEAMHLIQGGGKAAAQ
jgi:hypothetical protein